MPAPLPAPRPRSEAQRQAARRNGARSRGPVTAAGKARSSRNALRHGLCAAATIVAPGEDPAAFAALLADLRAEHRPRDVTTDQLVQRLAVTLWKLARCDRLEAELAACRSRAVAGALDGEGVPDLLARSAELALLWRHQAQLERALHRLLRALGPPVGRPPTDQVPRDPAPLEPESGTRADRANEPGPAAAFAPGGEHAPSASDPEPGPAHTGRHEAAGSVPFVRNEPEHRPPPLGAALGPAEREAAWVERARRDPRIARALVDELLRAGQFVRARDLLRALGPECVRAAGLRWPEDPSDPAAAPPADTGPRDGSAEAAAPFPGRPG